MKGSVPYRILYTGGGTGGHVTPNLAMHSALAQRHPDAQHLYVGLKGKAEASMVPKAGIPIKFVASRPWPGRRPWALFLFTVAMLFGFTKSVWILLTWRPDLVIASGGYGTAPVILAAAFLRKLRLSKARIFIHESNVVLGKMNAVAAQFADVVGVVSKQGLPKAIRAKSIAVGYPVRPKTMGLDRAEARDKLGIPQDARVVFVFGGSQGAKTLNRAIVNSLPTLLGFKTVWIIHGTGKYLAGNSYNGAADTEAQLAKFPGLAYEKYIRSDFFDDIGTQYAAADLVICRAGAGTLNEVCAAGMPAIVVPKINLPGEHQALNGHALASQQAAVLLLESVTVEDGQIVDTVDHEKLTKTIVDLLCAPDKLASLREAAKQQYDPDVLNNIVNVLESLLNKTPIKQGQDETNASESDVSKLSFTKVLEMSSNKLDVFLREVKSGQKTLAQEDKWMFEYKINGYFISSNYVLRARACRMAGLMGYTQALPILMHIFKPNRGLFKDVPIVRRDALVGLKGLMDFDASVRQSPEVLEGLIEALEDPYYEARAVALTAIGKFSFEHFMNSGLMDQSRYAEICSIIESCLLDHSFEVREAAVMVLGTILNDGDRLIKALIPLRFDRVWKVRAAMYLALESAVTRGILKPDTAKHEMRQILATSIDNRPVYPMKEAAKKLSDTIKKTQSKSE